ncbi:MAG: TlyA family rRNA (cytidine-2'-O)-methyltransferase [Deltaproteobacteria bacterium]|nr:TlyA family rRNA (cytidine-2'-O)-methyltransferase [Deltaproteobacteria bacterium]
MGTRERLDVLLVERQLVASREDGRRKILAAEVLVNQRPVTKAGALVDPTAEIRLKQPALYVSRGGVKLEKGLSEFAIEVNDKVALDVGASTGGFTDCLLTRGARRVYSVDVGYGQLDWKLRNDSRVLVLERKNIRYLGIVDLPSAADIATIDVSFISLRLVLPQVKTLLYPGGDIVALIKPQFEVGKGKVGKGGVIRSYDEHMRVIEEIKQAALALGFLIGGVTESPLLGPKGNKEFLIHLRLQNSLQ